jgi:hypothetical protein
MSKTKDLKRTIGEQRSLNNYYVDDNPIDIHGNKLPIGAAMVAKCVAHYRKAMKPLRTIWLRPNMWNDFEFWSRSCMTVMEGDSPITNFTFDGVFIKKGSSLQRDDIVWDFYPTTQTAMT